MSKNSYKKKLLSNTLVFAIGNFSSRILTFILIPIYTRTLSSQEYGYVDLITITVTLLLPIFTLNIHEAVIRFCLDKNINNDEVFNIGIKAVFWGLIPLLVASPFVMKAFKIQNLIIYFLLTYLVTALKNVFMYYARGSERVKLVVTLGVTETFLLLIFNILSLLVFKLGIMGYFTSLIVSTLIVLVIYLFKLKINFSKVFSKKNKKLQREMLKYSIPMVPNSLSWWISNTSDKYILTYFAGVSVTGLYAIAYKIPSLLNTITKIFMDAWQISAVEEFEDGRQDNFSNVYTAFFGINILVCSGLIIFSKYIAIIMFSKTFFEAVNFVPLLLCAYFFNGLSSYLGSIYTASKKTNMLFVSTSVGALLNICLNFILIPKIGAYGAAISTLSSYFVIWFVRFRDTSRIISMTINLVKMYFQVGILLILTILFTRSNESYTFAIGLILITILLILNRFIFKVLLQLLKKIIAKRKGA